MASGKREQSQNEINEFGGLGQLAMTTIANTWLGATYARELQPKPFPCSSTPRIGKL